MSGKLISKFWISEKKTVFMKQRKIYDLQPKNVWVKFPFHVNFWLTGDPKISTQVGNFPRSFSGGNNLQNINNFIAIGTTFLL